MRRTIHLDRYAASNENFVLIADPHSGPRRAERANQALPTSQGRGPVGISTASLWLVPVLVLALLPVSADAQGKSGKAKSGGGPAFCRSGAGHPVFGWEWCRQRGWGNSSAARNDRPVRQGRGDAYPDRDRDRRMNDVAFDNGYADGYEKGLDDGRDGRTADPTRHGWYRSADRHYDPQYGSRAHYANLYRDGFKSGYQAGFADGAQYGGDNGSHRRFPWPF